MKTDKISKKNYNLQPVVGVILFIVLLCVSFYLNTFAAELSYSLIFGLLVGFIIHRSRICFTAALRDPFLFGLTELTRAIILSLMITTIGFGVFQYSQAVQGLELSGKILELGWHIPIGAFIFGLGAAVSGGCASGTLMRFGEGYQLQFIALIGFIFGSVHGAVDASFWYDLKWNNRVSHLSDLTDWSSAIIGQVFILLVLYIALYFWEKYKFSK